MDTFSPSLQFRTYVPLYMDFYIHIWQKTRQRSILPLTMNENFVNSSSDKISIKQ